MERSWRPSLSAAQMETHKLGMAMELRSPQMADTPTQALRSWRCQLEALLHELHLLVQ